MDAASILNKAAKIQQERAAQRDAPDGERSMARAVAAFNALTGWGLTETDGWLFMMQLKASRAQHGAFVADDYDDFVGYASLWAESAYPESTTAPPPPLNDYLDCGSARCMDQRCPTGRKNKRILSQRCDGHSSPP